jgi:tetratricopeptide (TPR) repeat protein
MADYAVAPLEEIEVLDDGRLPWRPIRHHFGITAFGATAWTAVVAGERLINEHDESDGQQEELYLVHSGRAVFELDGERRDAPAGTFVFVKPGVKRTAFAQEPGTTVVVVGATPGKPYEDVGWELWAMVRPLYAAGNYEAAADRAREVADAHPGYAALWYNLACCESLAGQSGDAVEHLRRAVGMSEQCRLLAREDSDIDPIRGEPGVAEMLED